MSESERITADVQVSTGTGFQPADLFVHDGTEFVEATHTVQSRNYIFLSTTEMETIRGHVDAGDEPWSSAADALLADADDAVNASPRSVWDNGGACDVDEKSWKDASYWATDISAGGSRHDYRAAIDMCRWIRDAATAWQLTRTDRYAEAAIDKLHHWFVENNSHMHPSPWNRGPHVCGATPQGGDIEHNITIPGMWYGAAMVWEHPYWADRYSGSKDDILTWIPDYIEHQFDGFDDLPVQNYGPWRLSSCAAASVFMDQYSDEDWSADITRTFNKWRETIPDAVDAEGFMVEEVNRGSAFHYSLYGLKAYAMTAEVARHQGVNLYSHTDSDGVVLERAFDRHVPFMLGEEEWPYSNDQEGRLNDDEPPALYELAYNAYGKSDYLECVRANRNSPFPPVDGGRPVWDRRLLGWVSLTHGAR